MTGHDNLRPCFGRRTGAAAAFVLNGTVPFSFDPRPVAAGRSLFGGTAVATISLIVGVMKVDFIFVPEINLIAFAISAVIGVMFGYFPARRAAGLDPIDALQHE